MKVPRYILIKEALLSLISGSQLKTNERIPSERQLAIKLNCSRSTVKRAINELVKEEILYQIHGSGTFVKTIEERPSVSIGDNSPISLSKGIIISGKTPTNIVKSFKLIHFPSNSNLVEIFPSYTEFYELMRIRVADDDYLSFQLSYFPFRLFEDAHRYDFGKYSLYDYMEYKGLKPIYFNKTIEISSMDEEIREIMSTDDFNKSICIDYYGYTEDKILVEYTKSYFNAEKVNLKFIQRR